MQTTMILTIGINTNFGIESKPSPRKHILYLPKKINTLKIKTELDKVKTRIDILERKMNYILGKIFILKTEMNIPRKKINILQRRTYALKRMINTLELKKSNITREINPITLFYSRTLIPSIAARVTKPIDIVRPKVLYNGDFIKPNCPLKFSQSINNIDWLLCFIPINIPNYLLQKKEETNSNEKGILKQSSTIKSKHFLSSSHILSLNFLTNFAVKIFHLDTLFLYLLESIYNENITQVILEIKKSLNIYFLSYFKDFENYKKHITTMKFVQAEQLKLVHNS